MSPIVNGKWYATMAEGYADSAFFKGEVTHCVHGRPLGRCSICAQALAAQEAERRERWAARDAYEALPWWKRLLRCPPSV